jgi:hypothetical protein
MLMLMLIGYLLRGEYLRRRVASESRAADVLDSFLKVLAPTFDTWMTFFLFPEPHINVANHHPPSPSGLYGSF